MLHHVRIKMDILAVMGMIPTILLPFNLIKATLNGALVLLLYKPISTALKKSGLLASSTEAKPTEHNKLRSILVTAVSVVMVIASLVIIFLVLK